MRKVALFLEDLAHENLIGALVKRVANEHKIEINVTSINIRGGHGKVLAELRQFLRDLERGTTVGVPDLLVIATDANCKGLNERCREVSECIPERFKDRFVCAIPDPHIERWMLIDSGAFKQVFGRGCSAPDQKCDRDRYKNLLINAIAEAGVSPFLGGLESADRVVERMNLDVVARNDKSLKQFLSTLHQHLTRWKSNK